MTKEEFIKKSVLLLEKKLEKAIPPDEEDHLTESEMWDILCETVLRWTGLIK